MPRNYSIYSSFLATLLVAAFLSSPIAQAGPTDLTDGYYGPLYIFATDRDRVTTMPNGEFFRVFRWHESTSPFFDLASSDLPEYVDIPMEDWEIGVASPIEQYNLNPIKGLVGKYVDESRHIRSPGNSYYDKPILLSNGTLFNPRFYFQNSDTYMNFRTTSDSKPLVQFTRAMVKSKKVGPAFPLFELSTRPNVPVISAVVTMAGNEESEWDEAMDIMVEGKLLAPGAKVDRTYAINNPRLMLNDPTSTSQIGRADQHEFDKKVAILSYMIDNILMRRIDRQNPPRPNVLVYPEDNIEIVKKVKEMFLKKINGVQDYDRDMNRAQPPLRLVLWNLAPKEYYAPIPNYRRNNPTALANNSVDLAEVMVFESNYRYTPGATVVQYFNPKDPAAKTLALAFGIPEARAKRILLGAEDCSELLSTPPAPDHTKKGAKP